MATPAETDRPWAMAGQVLLPAATTAFVAFQAGGYFAGATASAALLLGLILVGVVIAGRAPLRALGPAALVVAGCLAALAGWQLASSAWSHAAGRAVIEADRSLLYLVAFVLGAVVLGGGARPRRAALGVALGLLTVCAAALLARTLPDVLHTTPSPVERGRASWPLTYWNALGLAAAVSTVLAVHFASARGPLALRLGAAAALPVAITTLMLTFSRGGIAVTVIGLVVYAMLVPTRRTLCGLLSGAPAAVSAGVALGSHLDATHHDIASSAHTVLLVTVACALATVALRAGLAAVVDGPMDERPEAGSTGLRRAVQATVAAAVVVALLALLASGALSRAYDDFAHQHTSAGQTRQRLTQLSGNGRVDAWHIALRMWADAPVGGRGAGTFSTFWFARRSDNQDLFDAHSLYAETLGELGVVGFALVVIPLLVVLWRLGLRYRGDRDPLDAALLAAVIAWAVHAGVDWDWEMPAVSVWIFFVGGAVLARHVPRVAARTGPPARVLVAAGIALALVMPAREGWSQHRLNQAELAYRQGRCAETSRRALDALSAVPGRAEPYQLIGYCDLRVGAVFEAVSAFRLGLDRDPRNWELAYALAVGQAAAGQDPRAIARRARQLDPREPLVRYFSRALARTGTPAWPALATTLRLPPA